MIRSLVFDKDGVILDLVETWFPVVEKLVDYTLDRLPEEGRTKVTRTSMLASVGVDEATGEIDPLGIFAMGSFTDIRAVWQQLMPPGMIDLREDESYRLEVRRLVREMSYGKTVPKGDVVTPMTRLAQAGFRLAVLTNDSEESARRSLEDIGILSLFDPVIGADSGYGGKPDPEGLLHCLSVHGTDISEALMIGDTGADFGAARNAGVADFICIADDPEYRPHEDVNVANVIAVGRTHRHLDGPLINLRGQRPVLVQLSHPHQVAYPCVAHALRR